jgi:hypothetical protein
MTTRASPNKIIGPWLANLLNGGIKLVEVVLGGNQLDILHNRGLLAADSSLDTQVLKAVSIN